MLGMFSLNRLGVQGSALQMISHGISTGALFAIVGMLYERYHTREIRHLGGLAAKTPWLAFFMLLFTFSSIGLPGLNGFAGEFLVLIGTFQRSMGSPLIIVAVLAVLGVVLGAWYMLYLVQRLFFGQLREPALENSGTTHEVRDLSWREFSALAPLAVFVFWIGLQPSFFLKPMEATLNSLVAPAAEARQAAENKTAGTVQLATEQLNRKTTKTPQRATGGR